MHFGLSEEQEALRDTTRRFLAQQAPVAWSRSRWGLGWDAALWRREAEELGWAALALPAAYGGFGLGMVEVVVLQEELGRVLHPSPFFATCCLAAPLLLDAGTEAQKARWLPAFAAGEATGALGWMSTPRGYGVDGVGGEAVVTADGYRLSGTLLGVVDGATADVLLVALRCAGDVALFLVERGTAGVTVSPHATMDGTRALATLHLDAVRVPTAAGLDGAGESLARALDRGAVALAAEQLGAAEVALDMAVAYAKVRHQFGRPIGSFQAIKHRCADLLVRVESARSAAWYAAAVADGAGEAGELPLAASVARSWCTDTVFEAAAENIQIHGGIGFTWEHDAHLYFKRAQSSAALLGDAAWHRAQLADRLGW